jgi:ATP-dependent exoDNAse (exonuclease V) alpha subunit
MALYRCEVKIFSREKRGRSVVAASAYRSGSKIRDERHDKIHDYSRRSKGVVESVILRPEGSPEWTAKPSTLWNTVELGEKRTDAQLAREFILAVPPELSAKEQFDLATGWAQSELVSKGMVAEVSLHHTKTGNNPHVHILATMRTLDGDKFSAKKPREWNRVEQLRDWRESWATAVNGALEKAGRPERVDHRSLKDRGIDRIPEPKIGVAATAMKRRGVVADPIRFQLVRYVKSLNFARPWLRAIEKAGEVYQQGAGGSWWERSLLLASETGKAVRNKVMDAWQAFSRTRLPDHDIPNSPRGPEPDMDRSR